MSATPTHYSAARLTEFAAASLWHRRMAKTGVHTFINKVQPRLCAELVLHPITPRDRGESSSHDSRRAPHVFHAA
jgi:hypothetical protein